MLEFEDADTNCHPHQSSLEERRVSCLRMRSSEEYGSALHHFLALRLGKGLHHFKKLNRFLTYKWYNHNDNSVGVLGDHMEIICINLLAHMADRVFCWLFFKCILYLRVCVCVYWTYKDCNIIIGSEKTVLS